MGGGRRGRHSPCCRATQETAILLASIGDQYELMDRLTCGEGGAGRWTSTSRASVGSPPAFDLHSLRCTVGKEQRSLWFDLSVWTPVMTAAFKGEPPPGMTTAQVEELLMEVFEELK